MFTPPPRVKQLIDREFGLWIDGAERPAADNSTMPTTDPTTGDVLTHVPRATAADVDEAVQSAARAQPGWYALGTRERGRAFHRLAELVREHREDLALLEAANSGNPYSAMLVDIDMSLELLEYWPAVAMSMTGQTIPASPGNLHYTVHQPYGVVGRIVAFNHPLMFAITRMLPALIVGNTVVLKPADQTPLSALLLGDLLRQAFPPGVVNIVTGGPETGAALVRHPLIKRIAFTGSTRVGRLIQQTAAETGVKHVSLELGGKNPMIVFPDANVEEAAAGAIFGMNFCACQGQSCGSNSRVFVHADHYDRFLEALVDGVSRIKVGAAYDPAVEMGPVVSAAHRDRVMGYIQAGRDEGARLLYGGDRPDGDEFSRGFFIAPTVFADVNMDMKIAREEIFGPVVSVFRWDDYEDVLRQANDAEYGLTASIWTQDIDIAHKTADRLEAGYIWINDSTRHYWGTPFGGWKQSGTGREECVEELYSYTETKTVHVRLQR